MYFARSGNQTGGNFTIESNKSRLGRVKYLDGNRGRYSESREKSHLLGIIKRIDGTGITEINFNERLKDRNY